MGTREKEGCPQGKERGLGRNEPCQHLALTLASSRPRELTPCRSSPQLQYLVNAARADEGAVQRSCPSLDATMDSATRPAGVARCE